MNKDLILSIDQGTSGSKAVVFDRHGSLLCDGRAPLNSFYPSEGYVEQDPEEILSSVISAMGKALEELASKGREKKNIKCCGISNQRETFLLWDKESGRPLAPAIVWQCKRSLEICEEIIQRGEDKFLRERTGLYADPYFSGSKLIWLYRHNDKIRDSIDTGNACFGTVDTWLLYRLTRGASYKTDYTNASRTLLFNLKSLCWDKDILRKYSLENLNLPEALPSSSRFGESRFEGLFDRPLPITGILGDSHAAAFGERCFQKGSAKATMGTGASILLNTGNMIDPSATSMVSTICWSTKETVSYALEGIIVSCGSTLTWMSRQLGFFKDGREADMIAESIGDNGNVFLVPAFSGLGAPWWKMNQKALIHGLTFDSNKSHIVRAALESIVYQITDVIKAMEKASGAPLKSLQIDGGVSASPFITKQLADLNDTEIIRCRQREASALGAALMAGLGQGLFTSIDNLMNLKYNDEIIPSDMTSDIETSYSQWVSILQGL